MIQPDIATMRFLSAIEYALLPTVLWTFLWQRRSRPVLYWTLGGWLIGAGNLLLLAQFQVWFAGSDLLLRLIFLGGLLARSVAFRSDLGVPLRSRALLHGVLAYMVAHEMIRWAFPEPTGLLLFTSLVTCAVTFYLAWLAFKLSQAYKSRGALWLVGQLSLFGVLFLARVIALATGHTPLDQLGSSAVAIAIGVALVILPVVEHMAYLGYCLERARYDESTALTTIAHQREVDSLQRQIAHLDRKRILGEMATSLSHEISQPLVAIVSYSQLGKTLADSAPPETQSLSDLFAKIDRNASRARQILDRIRRYIQPANPGANRLDVLQLLLETTDLLEVEAKRHAVAVHIVDSSDAVSVQGDALQLSQVLVNIVRNGIEAAAHSPERWVRLEYRVLDGQVCIAVQDSGPGFSSQGLTQAGHMFYTSKADGLGVGLSIAEKIIASHGGSLAYSNSPPHGARVTICLPKPE